MDDFASARAGFDQLLKERKVLNVAHRALLGGNVMENTYRGFLAGFRNGADMIEIDTAATTDGVYFLIHDGMELRVQGCATGVVRSTAAEFAARHLRNTCGHDIGSPERLLDTLPRLKGKGLINLDRSWRYWGKGLLDALHGLDMYRQLLVKCPAEDLKAVSALESSGRPFMFMAMARKQADLRALFERHVNLVAAELLFGAEDHELLEPAFIKELKARGVAVWVNAITMSNGEEWSNVSAHHDDDGAVLGDPDAHWGWLIDHGADAIQTDWPALLYCYLRQRFPGTRPELMAKN